MGAHRINTGRTIFIFQLVMRQKIYDTNGTMVLTQFRFLLMLVCLSSRCLATDKRQLKQNCQQVGIFKYFQYTTWVFLTYLQHISFMIWNDHATFYRRIYKANHGNTARSFIWVLHDWFIHSNNISCTNIFCFMFGQLETFRDQNWNTDCLSSSNDIFDEIH